MQRSKNGTSFGGGWRGGFLSRDFPSFVFFAITRARAKTQLSPGKSRDNRVNRGQPPSRSYLDRGLISSERRHEICLYREKARGEAQFPRSPIPARGSRDSCGANVRGLGIYSGHISRPRREMPRTRAVYTPLPPPPAAAARDTRPKGVEKGRFLNIPPGSGDQIDIG